MAVVKGKLITCDRCGSTCFLKCVGEGKVDGFYTKCDKFEKAPEGWEWHSYTRMLCPRCNKEYTNIIENFMSKATIRNEPDWFTGGGRDDVLG